MATPIPPNATHLTAYDVLAATGGRVVFGDAESAAATSVTTDSRAVGARSAFIALRGERHDGHAYLEAAARAGASILIVAEDRSPAAFAAATRAASGSLVVVEVVDTLVAFGAIARAHLRRYRQRRGHVGAGKVIAITGSAGKTTTKELCAALLAQRGPCRATIGNLNNRIGLPATALTVEDSDAYVVLEAGMSVPGEIAALAAIAEPDVAIVTTVGLAHAEGVGGTRAHVAHEKGALFAALAPTGVAVVNADDDAAMAQLARTTARRVEPFGRSERARYRLHERVAAGTSGSRLVVSRPEDPARAESRRERFEVELPLVGEAASIDFLAALAAADAACEGPLDADEVAAAMRAMARPQGRAEVKRLASGLILVDDSYNANPSSMREAIATLGELAALEGRRAVAVLGDMKELGDSSAREHERLGELLSAAKVAAFVGVGPLTRAATSRARALGLSVHEADDAEAAAARLLELAAPGDIVLVKASRSIGLERVARALEERFGIAGAAKGAP
jgi:UDP-N-acetylmuramoyl-tripeptide--D-alanyl-D-alanine ligase